MLFLFIFSENFGMKKDKVPKKTKKNSTKKNSVEKKEIIIHENSSPVCFAKSKEMRDEYQ